MESDRLFSVVVVKGNHHTDRIGPFISVLDAVDAVIAYPPALNARCVDLKRSIRPLPIASDVDDLVALFEDDAFTYQILYDRPFPRPMGVRGPWNGSVTHR